VKDLGHTGTQCIQVKSAITPLRVVTSTSDSGANMRTTPTSATQNVCYGNAGCLATELKILGFMTS